MIANKVTDPTDPYLVHGHESFGRVSMGESALNESQQCQTMKYFSVILLSSGVLKV